MIFIIPRDYEYHLRCISDTSRESHVPYCLYSLKGIMMKYKSLPSNLWSIESIFSCLLILNLPRRHAHCSLGDGLKKG